MANNYETGANLIPAKCFAPGGAEAAVLINGELQDILGQDSRPEDFDDFCADSLNTEMTGDGSLYISSGSEFFCYPSFEYLISKLSERKLILISFDIQIAFTCSKLRPGEHGGVYYRALPNGEILAISTQLGDLTDEQLRQLICTRESPDTYTSAPDA
jgi:hypothetical protein